MQIYVAAITDSGRRRSRNEDRYLAVPPIIAVADGMGGHDMGDKAAEIMIEELARQTWQGHDYEEAAQMVQRAVECARVRIVGVFDGTSAEKSDEKGEILKTYDKVGGTTLAGAVHVQSRQWLVFHIGDSRVYLWRKGKLMRTTKDHSLVQQMIDSGEITEDEAREHPRRSVITRAIGTYGPSLCDIGMIGAHSGDILVACSDGLSDEVQDDDLAAVIAESLEDSPDCLEGLAFALRDVALAHGGRDNVTVAVMGLGE